MHLFRHLLLPIACGAAAFGMARWQEKAYPSARISHQPPAAGEPSLQNPESWLNKIRDARDIAALARLWDSMRGELVGSPLLASAAEPILARMVELDAAEGWAWVLTLDKNVPGQELCRQNFLKAWGWTALLRQQSWPQKPMNNFVKLTTNASRRA